MGLYGQEFRLVIVELGPSKSGGYSGPHIGVFWRPVTGKHE